MTDSIEDYIIKTHLNIIWNWDSNTKSDLRKVLEQLQKATTSKVLDDVEKIIKSHIGSTYPINCDAIIREIQKLRKAQG